jgi:hypothetical protein
MRNARWPARRTRRRAGTQRADTAAAPAPHR